MSLATEHGQLSPDDLARYQAHRALMQAMELSPSHYNRDEIERAYKNTFVLWGEFIERYELPASDDNLVIDPNTGRCYVSGP